MPGDGSKVMALAENRLVFHDVSSVNEGKSSQISTGKKTSNTRLKDVKGQFIISFLRSTGGQGSDDLLDGRVEPAPELPAVRHGQRLPRARLGRQGEDGQASVEHREPRSHGRSVRRFRKVLKRFPTSHFVRELVGKYHSS